MNKIVSILITLLISFWFANSCFAQSINIPGLGSSNIRYNPFSNNISFNSRYVNVNKRIGPANNIGAFPNYLRPYNYNNFNRFLPYYPGYSINRYVPYRNPYNFNRNIPLGKYGNTNIYANTNGFRPGKIYIYSY